MHVFLDESDVFSAMFPKKNRCTRCLTLLSANSWISQQSTSTKKLHLFWFLWEEMGTAKSFLGTFDSANWLRESVTQANLYKHDALFTLMYFFPTNYFLCFLCCTVQISNCCIPLEKNEFNKWTTLHSSLWYSEARFYNSAKLSAPIIWSFLVKINSRNTAKTVQSERGFVWLQHFAWQSGIGSQQK